jgi:hypothetical protein
MHLPINVKSPKTIRKWQVGFNWAFKGLNKNKENIVLPLVKLVTHLRAYEGT